jgi:hypothetical protein
VYILYYTIVGRHVERSMKINVLNMSDYILGKTFLKLLLLLMLLIVCMYRSSLRFGDWNKIWDLSTIYVFPCFQRFLANFTFWVSKICIFHYCTIVHRAENFFPWNLWKWVPKYPYFNTVSLSDKMHRIKVIIEKLKSTVHWK